MTTNTVPDFSQLSDDELLRYVEQGPTTREGWFVLLREVFEKRKLHNEALIIIARAIEHFSLDGLHETDRLLAYMTAPELAEPGLSISRLRIAVACLTIATMEADAQTERGCKLFERALHWATVLSGVYSLDTLITIGKRARCAHHRWVVLFKMANILSVPQIEQSSLRARVDWPLCVATTLFAAPDEPSTSHLETVDFLQTQNGCAVVIALLDPDMFHVWWETVEERYPPKRRKDVARELTLAITRRKACVNPRYETASLEAIVAKLLAASTAESA